MEAIKTVVSLLRDREEGQGLIEYSLIAVLISIVAIVIMGTVGQDVIQVFTDVSAALAG